ncbi:TPA: hypothetical protein ACH3X1_000019 [Trebouxia sp. C0004]
MHFPLLTARLCYCNYTYEDLLIIQADSRLVSLQHTYVDLLFIQVCSGPTPILTMLGGPMRPMRRSAAGDKQTKQIAYSLGASNLVTSWRVKEGNFQGRYQGEVSSSLGAAGASAVGDWCFS